VSPIGPRWSLPPLPCSTRKSRRWRSMHLALELGIAR
jgi:hypothetical protein